MQRRRRSAAVLARGVPSRSSYRIVFPRFFSPVKDQKLSTIHQNVFYFSYNAVQKKKKKRRRLYSKDRVRGRNERATSGHVTTRSAAAEFRAYESQTQSELLRSRKKINNIFVVPKRSPDTFALRRPFSSTRYYTYAM